MVNDGQRWRSTVAWSTLADHRSTTVGLPVNHRRTTPVNRWVMVGSGSGHRLGLDRVMGRAWIGSGPGLDRVGHVAPPEIYLRLHGVPESIMSDMDKVFLRTFWKELFKLLHVKLLLSTSYHPQTDGQIEVLNRCLEWYLRCMTREHPKEWFTWVPLAKCWYNSNYHSAIDTTHSEALYGQSPPVHVPYIGGLSKVDVVDRSLIAREQAIEVMRFHLFRAQNRMKQQADKNRIEREFEVGNWVLLKLQPYWQVSIRQGKQNKFSPKYFGPFKVVAKIGTVAYKLKLPAGSQIHDVFHVSQLKKVHGNHQEQIPTVLPQVNNEGLMEVTPLKILERKIVKKNNVVAVYGLIQ
ncbi:retrotransposable element Tf2 [Tanacetum coccineum]